MKRVAHALLGPALGWLFLAGAAAQVAEEPLFHDEPEIGWMRGDHHLDLAFGFRYRYENWQAFVPVDSDFHALRARIGLDYRYRETFRLFVQGNLSSLMGLENPTRASGEGLIYRNVAGESGPLAVKLSQLVAALQGGENWVRLGRDAVGAGTSDRDEESTRLLLKRERLGERLLGSVDWSQGSRAYDGASGGTKLGLHHLLHAYVYQPTTGVYDLKSGYGFQQGVIVGGLDWNAIPGAFPGRWSQNSEVGAFFIAYSDDRDPAKVVGLEGDIEVYTLGASWLGVYPVGPGTFDALAWGAFQFGDYVDTGPTSGTQPRNQLAGAFIAEVGYQLPEVWASPWLRLGVNYASGDANLDDRERSTFFNVLPSNHRYYGIADQLALQNLLDLLVQVRFTPTEGIRVEFTYHRFWLDESADFRWSGTGAFNRTSLGFTRNPSNGSNDVGHEFDLVVRAPLEDGVTLSAGYSAMLGGDVFALLARSNLDFAYVEMEFEY